jgi:hypothetical protein
MHPAVGNRHFAGIFLISVSTLLLELALTRVLSVALWYHFGFLVIATALLGFGAAGTTVALAGRLRETEALDRALALACGASGAAILVSYWLIQRLPFDPFALGTQPMQWVWMPLYELALVAPFYSAGIAVSLLLSRATEAANRLYAFDLIGAGIGCTAIAGLMPSCGGSGSVLAAAALGFAAAAVFGLRVRKIGIAAAALAVLAAGLAPFGERLVPVHVNANKRPKPRSALLSEWNTFSRVEVFESPADPKSGTLPERNAVIDSGTASTGMFDLRDGIDAWLTRPLPLGESSSMFGVLPRGGRVLVIGSGCGAGVFDALRAGAGDVTAVDINPIISSLGRTVLHDWWGGLYDRPEVHPVVDEARSFVRRSHDRYDMIEARHTISNAAAASGALSLSENYVLTSEGFDDYFDHLAPGGVLAFTRPEVQLPRLLATIRGMFERHGLGSPVNNVYVFRQPLSKKLIERFGPRKAFSAGIIARLTPFTPDDIAALERGLGVGAKAPPDFEGSLPETTYSPFARTIDPIYARVLDDPDPARFYAELPYDATPVTDDRPFFNQRVRWSRLGWADVRSVFAQRAGRLALEDKPVAEVTLLVILAQATLVAAALILWPLFRFARGGLGGRSPAATLLYFASLGLGFILVEMALLQRFALFLGQPVYTLAAVLASLLVFSGIGSAIAGRFTEPRRALRYVVPVLLAVLLATATLVPVIFAATLGQPLVARVGIAIAVLAPLGVVLGMPFATGLRAIGGGGALVPWAWGVNGFFTVIGSVAGLILGMAVGFRVVLFVAALAYALGTLPFLRARELPGGGATAAV